MSTPTYNAGNRFLFPPLTGALPVTVSFGVPVKRVRVESTGVDICDADGNNLGALHDTEVFPNNYGYPDTLLVVGESEESTEVAFTVEEYGDVTNVDYWKEMIEDEGSGD